MSKVLDFKRPHRPLGPKDQHGYQWYQQNNKIFGWSESNVRFEEAWWLDDKGEVIHSASSPEHIAAVTRDRPFKPEWLYYSKVHYRGILGLTACNPNWDHLPPGSLLTMTKNKAAVTCGNCRRTQGYFSRDDDPDDKIHQIVTR